jgi:hypothetical protein
MKPRVCDIFAKLRHNVASGKRVAVEYFENEAGCGLATGKPGAHFVFKDNTGAFVFVTCYPSMIDTRRWQYSWQVEDQGSGDRDSLVMDNGHYSLDKAIELIVVRLESNPRATPVS